MVRPFEALLLKPFLPKTEPGTHNMSYAHTDQDVLKLLAAYDEILPIARDTIASESLDESLRCASLEPLFKVR